MEGVADAVDATLGRGDDVVEGPARLTNSTPLRLDHSGSTGLRSGA
jgi:hypothetical protein